MEVRRTMYFPLQNFLKLDNFMQNDIFNRKLIKLFVHAFMGVNSSPFARQ